MNIEVVAIVNDTVGTLMAHAYTDPATKVGIYLYYTKVLSLEPVQMLVT